ncbi:oleate hydratase [Variovorax sp. VRV01]|nr:oleate hydratase [Variovorax sp. VRV01]
MKAYFVGGGIGSLAGAAFMIRDAGVAGAQITIIERSAIAGGSLDAAPHATGGYSLRGGRMLTSDHYECLWDLLKTIPSLDHPEESVFEETARFNREHPAHSSARLVDQHRFKLDVSSMGFTNADRLELVRLAETSEDALGTSRITDWLSPPFFRTNFWWMWQTTFAFQPWHSAVELKRYLHRFMNEFPRIETLAGVKRTVYNQYDSIVQPLEAWLRAGGVNFVHGTTVTEMDLRDEGGQVTVQALHVLDDAGTRRIAVGAEDLVFFQNASMTDASSTGSMELAAPRLTMADSGGWTLWEKIARGRPEFGNPAAFNSSIAESYWASFTVTCNTTAFFDRMESFSGDRAGTGGLVTFKDSNWQMSVVLYHQPHFRGQRADQQVFWGYALQPDRVGNFVPKAMSDCSGAEILQELRGHLNFDPEVLAGAICIPCRLPYITSMFMPRAKTDRPLPVPKCSRNLAFVSQFVEIGDDVVFTVEYSVRAAQMAVYQLLGVRRQVPPITRHDHSLKVMFDSLVKSFS